MINFLCWFQLRQYKIVVFWCFNLGFGFRSSSLARDLIFDAWSRFQIYLIGIVGHLHLKIEDTLLIFLLAISTIAETSALPGNSQFEICWLFWTSSELYLPLWSSDQSLICHKFLDVTLIGQLSLLQKRNLKFYQSDWLANTIFLRNLNIIRLLIFSKFLEIILIMESKIHNGFYCVLHVI